jgi:hypothetical protein
VRVFQRLLVIFLTAALPSLTLAENQGALAPKSSDFIRISLSILPSIRINTVSTISLTIAQRDIDAIYSEQLCITGNFGGKYSMVAYGSEQGASAFSLSNQSGGKLAFHVDYRRDATDSYSTLQPGVPSNPYSLKPSESCSDDESFRVTFRTLDLKGAESGLYTGSLTLMVSPV